MGSLGSHFFNKMTNLKFGANLAANQAVDQVIPGAGLVMTGLNIAHRNAKNTIRSMSDEISAVQNSLIGSEIQSAHNYLLGHYPNNTLQDSINMMRSSGWLDAITESTHSQAKQQTMTLSNLYNHVKTNQAHDIGENPGIYMTEGLNTILNSFMK